MAGGKGIFFHINDYSRRHYRPILGLTVKYRSDQDAQGRLRAVEVIPFKDHKDVSKENKQQLFSYLLCIVFFVLLFFLEFKGTISFPASVIYFFVSVLTFYMYYREKAAAQRGEWRIPESTLHFLSFIGGWPGAALAQSCLRHKSQKTSFRFTYWVTVVLNIVLLIIMMTVGKGVHLK